MTPNLAVLEIESPHWRMPPLWLPLFLLWIPVILLSPLIFLVLFGLCYGRRYQPLARHSSLLGNLLEPARNARPRARMTAKCWFAFCNTSRQVAAKHTHAQIVKLEEFNERESPSNSGNARRGQNHRGRSRAVAGRSRARPSRNRGRVHRPAPEQMEPSPRPRRRTRNICASWSRPTRQ